MSDSTQSSDEENGADSGSDVTRRAVLNGAVGTGALALGAGVVSANGKGGQGFIAAQDNEDPDFKDKNFKIVGGGGDLEGYTATFSCSGKAELPFPYWEIEYEGIEYEENEDYGDAYKEDSNRPRLFTRDNQIDTAKTYRWTNDKPCGDEKADIDGDGTEEERFFKQVGFAQTD